MYVLVLFRQNVMSNGMRPPVDLMSTNKPDSAYYPMYRKPQPTPADSGTWHCTWFWGVLCILFLIVTASLFVHVLTPFCIDNDVSFHRTYITWLNYFCRKVYCKCEAKKRWRKRKYICVTKCINLFPASVCKRSSLLAADAGLPISTVNSFSNQGTTRSAKTMVCRWTAPIMHWDGAEIRDVRHWGGRIKAIHYVPVSRWQASL